MTFIHYDEICTLNTRIKNIMEYITDNNKVVT